MKQRLPTTNPRLQSGSGAHYQKGDIQAGPFVVEVKATKHMSFSITSDLMDKIQMDALTHRRSPLVAVEMGDGTVVWVVNDATMMNLLATYVEAANETGA